jgi:uncharacterized CHY-type Zn-finger protein
MRCYHCHKDLTHAHAFLVRYQPTGDSDCEEIVYVCKKCLSAPVENGGRYVLKPVKEAT